MKLFLGLVVGLIIFVIWDINEEKKGEQQGGTKKIKNENTVGLAVIYIETAAKFIKENQDILNCNQITMWQHGEVGEGFTIEFYGYDPFFKVSIEKLLVDTFGSWKMWEDSKNEILHITHTGIYSYTGSWKNFNKTVWDAVERKYPEWKINKAYSHKYVLYV